MLASHYLMQDLILLLDSLTRVAIGPSVIANEILLVVYI